MKKELFEKYIFSPVGWLQIQTCETTLVSISFKDSSDRNSIVQPLILQNAALQLKEYFAGKRKKFNLELNPSGTPFQKEVWKYVGGIEFGKTASYLDIACQTRSKKNTRAVGMANGKNPIPIVIPCHRIIGTDGKLTGYAGGLEKKRWLLQHELKFSDNSDLLF